MAAGTTVVAECISKSNSIVACKILNQLSPDSGCMGVGNYGVLLNGDPDCATVMIKITVASQLPCLTSVKFLN